MRPIDRPASLRPGAPAAQEKQRNRQKNEADETFSQSGHERTGYRQDKGMKQQRATASRACEQYVYEADPASPSNRRVPSQ